MRRGLGKKKESGQESSEPVIGDEFDGASAAEAEEAEDQVIETDDVDDEDEEYVYQELDPESRFPKIAIWLAVIFPPAGLVMGHLWLAWSKDELSWSHTGSVLASRRKAFVAVFIGWPMLLLMVIGAVTVSQLVLEERQQSQAEEEMEQAQAEQREAMLEAASESESVGEVDEAFCAAMIDGVYPQMPVEGFVMHHDMISEELITGLETASETGASPNQEIYADYAGYLAGFSDQEEFEDFGDEGHIEQAEPFAEAVTSDIFACMDMDEDHADAVLDHNAERMEQMPQQPMP